MDDKNENLNLVIYDSSSLASDNGEYLYRRIRELFPNIHMVFLIPRDSRDFNRLKQDGFNVLSMQDERLKTILKQADFILFSKNSSGILNKLQPYYRNKTIFLGHGVSSKIYDDGSYFRGPINRWAKYILCTSNWEKEILDKYSNGRFETIKFGFPRHDVLLQKYNQLDFNSKPKQIFITFHWRVGGYLDSSEWSFRQSQYLKDINTLLNDERLKELVDNGIKVCFLPHARFMKYKRLFKVPNYIEVPIEKPFQDILVESDAIITDFSSNSFEMAYMNKPAIIYVPGINEVRLIHKSYHIENLNYPHMTYCKSKEEVFCKIKEVLDKPSCCKNTDIANKVFDHVDTDNTKRLVEWMFEQKKKEQEPCLENMEEHLFHRNSNIRTNKPTVSNTKRKGNPVYRFIKFAYG